jgi:hypothetical protein
MMSNTQNLPAYIQTLGALLLQSSDHVTCFCGAQQHHCAVHPPIPQPASQPASKQREKLAGAPTTLSIVCCARFPPLSCLLCTFPSTVCCAPFPPLSLFPKLRIFPNSLYCILYNIKHLNIGLFWIEKQGKRKNGCQSIIFFHALVLVNFELKAPVLHFATKLN